MEANADIHARTTAREIINDFEGEKLDYWVTGFGTGGKGGLAGRSVLDCGRPHCWLARSWALQATRFGMIGAIVEVPWRLNLRIMPDFWRNLIIATVGSIICIFIRRAILGS